MDAQKCTGRCNAARLYYTGLHSVITASPVLSAVSFCRGQFYVRWSSRYKLLLQLNSKQAPLGLLGPPARGCWLDDRCAQPPPNPHLCYLRLLFVTNRRYCFNSRSAQRTSGPGADVSHHLDNVRQGTRDSSVGIVTGYRLDGRGLFPGRAKKFISTPQRPDRLWGSPSLLSNGYRGHFLRG
jgi:hypothetical protein